MVFKGTTDSVLGHPLGKSGDTEGDISGGGAVSPRGDWRAPSDGNARAWLADLDENVPEG